MRVRVRNLKITVSSNTQSVVISVKEASVVLRKCFLYCVSIKESDLRGLENVGILRVNETSILSGIRLLYHQSVKTQC